MPQFEGMQFQDSSYWLYSDTCDFGLAAILQQVQKIQLKDVKGSHFYEKCKKLFPAGEPVQNLVVQIAKADKILAKNT